MAEDLTGTTFKRSSGNIFEFTLEDMIKFQKVADTKSVKGLKNAILDAFLKENEPHRTVNQRIRSLENLLIRLQQEVISKDEDNQSNYVRLKGQINQLDERICLIEEQPKIKKLLTKKS
jgi:exonuclease VII large subunit